MVEHVPSSDAWASLAADPAAQLVDVRTAAEWQFVGLPDLSPLGRRPLLIEWQGFPDGRPHPDFVGALRAAGARPDHTLIFICRSGQRSAAAAYAAEAAGFDRCLNVADGFEGPPDGAGHRGTVAGWKVAGLPWRQ